MSLVRVDSAAIAVLTIDNPPVNALSQVLRAALLDVVRRLATEPGWEGLVLIGKDRSFIAGADINEFDGPLKAPHLPDVLAAIEASVKPIVAAINGHALGGGLEVALACHQRLASDAATLGLPEVTLGVMPGAGGTQRLPRLIPFDQALDMALFGKSISATESLARGLVDGVCAATELRARAVVMARALADNSSQIRRTSSLPVRAQPSAAQSLEEIAAANARKFGRLEAPRAILASFRDCLTKPFSEAIAVERDRFITLREGPQSAALRHGFLAQRRAAKVPGLQGVDTRIVDSVGVIGAGTMGSGIALAFLSAGYSVTVVERSPDALVRGVATIKKTLESNVSSGRMTHIFADQCVERLSASDKISDLSRADLIVEAAFERMDIKQSIFRELDQVARPGALLASNTSYLDIDAIASATGRPRDVMGLHFFSPANIMKLLEIVRGKGTADDAIATGVAIARRLGKIGVISGNAYGFIGNRILAVRRREAEKMIVEGASPYDIDRIIEHFGFPMGPFRMADLAGLDLGWSEEKSTGSTVRERLCEAGRRGQKTSAGFYDYDGARKSIESPFVLSLIARFAKDHAVESRSFTEDELFARLTWPMIDEASRILEEGIALRASDIDLVWLHGYGWPAWTGGPLFYADQVGLPEVVDRLRLQGLEPNRLLHRLARDRMGFRDYDATLA